MAGADAAMHCRCAAAVASACASRATLHNPCLSLALLLCPCLLQTHCSRRNTPPAFLPGHAPCLQAFAVLLPMTDTCDAEEHQLHARGCGGAKTTNTIQELRVNGVSVGGNAGGSKSVGQTEVQWVGTHNQNWACVEPESVRENCCKCATSAGR